MQFINDPYGNRAASIGSAIGAGLGSGLQELAQHKYNELAQRAQTKQTFNALKNFGLDDQSAHKFANYLSIPQEIRGAAAQFQGQQPQGLPQMLGAQQQAQQVESPQLQQLRSLMGNFGAPANAQQDIIQNLVRKQLQQAQTQQPEAQRPAPVQQQAVTPAGVIQAAKEAAPKEQVKPAVPVQQIAPPPQQIQQPLTAEQFLGQPAAQSQAPLSKEQLAREKHELAKQKQAQAVSEKKQKQIEAVNAKELKDHNEVLRPSQELFTAAKDAYILLQSGKTPENLKGAITPENETASGALASLGLVSNETQQLVKDYNKIVTEKSGLQGGRQSDASRKLIAAGKPRISQSLVTQKRLVLETMEEGGEVQAREKIKDYLTTTNNDQQPANLRTKINQRWGEIQKSLQGVKNVPEGQEVETDEGIVFKRIGPKWYVWEI